MNITGILILSANIYSLSAAFAFDSQGLISDGSEVNENTPEPEVSSENVAESTTRVFCNKVVNFFAVITGVAELPEYPEPSKGTSSDDGTNSETKENEAEITTADCKKEHARTSDPNNHKKPEDQSNEQIANQEENTKQEGENVDPAGVPQDETDPSVGVPSTQVVNPAPVALFSFIDESVLGTQDNPGTSGYDERSEPSFEGKQEINTVEEPSNKVVHKSANVLKPRVTEKEPETEEIISESNDTQSSNARNATEDPSGKKVKIAGVERSESENSAEGAAEETSEEPPKLTDIRLSTVQIGEVSNGTADVTEPPVSKLTQAAPAVIEDSQTESSSESSESKQSEDDGAQPKSSHSRSNSNQEADNPSETIVPIEATALEDLIPLPTMQSPIAVQETKTTQTQPDSQAVRESSPVPQSQPKVIGKNESFNIIWIIVGIIVVMVVIPIPISYYFFVYRRQKQLQLW